MASRIAAGLALLLLQLVACSAPIRPYSTKPIVWKDDDERPFEKKPEVYLSPLIWNGTDHLIFLPMSNALSVKTGKESVDVNAVDEVPDSAWFTNRLSVGTMTPEEMARGSCRGESPELERPWTVTGAKFDGQTPGFTIRTKSGARYLLKFDDAKQPERASAADVIGSKIYYAAGFTAPCNRVVFFEAADMVVQEKADAGSGGKQVTREYVDQLLGLVPRAPDGKLRAMATELLEGQPLGPWKYEGLRADDPNDIIPHEDRREVRATRVLGAWLNHYDHGENNTLDMWIRVPAGGGYVKHDTLDWGMRSASSGTRTRSAGGWATPTTSTSEPPAGTSSPSGSSSGPGTAPTWARPGRRSATSTTRTSTPRSGTPGTRTPPSRG